VETKSEKKDFQQHRIERLEHAKEVSDILFGRYLAHGNDVENLARRYVSGIIEALAYYPPAVQTALADLRDGISGKIKTLPTPAHIFEMGDEAWKKIGCEQSPSKNNVMVLKGTSAWDAWQKNRGSTPCMTIRHGEDIVGEGWYFPTEFPETETVKKGS
jgi:hypothetical protein